MSPSEDREPRTQWRPLDGLDGLWLAEREVEGATLRSAALRLADGRLAIYSPIRGLGAEAHRELRALGEPAFLVAPNHYHNLGLKEYASAYPAAAVVASAAAAPRLKRKCALDVNDEKMLRDALPSGASVLVLPNASNGELWFSLRSSTHPVWIVGDGFFNLPRTPRTPIGLLLRLLGICSGLRIGSTFKWLLRDRPAYLRWLLAALDEHRPTALIPCHGDVLIDPALPSRLRELAEARL